MDRIHDILNSVNETLANSAQKTYKGQKRSELKDSDFLFPETRSFPIVSPQDVPDAISNYGRMKGQMSYNTFLKKLYNMAKRKGPEFVAALPEASKKQLNIKSKAEENENETPEMEMQEYKNDFYEMSLGSIRAIATHAQSILNSIDDEQVQENLTEPFLQGRIAITEDYMRSIHDYVMFSESEADDMSTKTEKKKKMPPFAPPSIPSTPSGGPSVAPAIPAEITEISNKKKKHKQININSLPKYQYVNTNMNDDSEDEQTTPQENQTLSGDKPGLWDNIRKKKQKEGKNYRPARPGEKDRPEPEQWKKLTK
jgi:hypothetical protein